MDGTLNWSKANLFSNEQAEYWYVPYNFNNGETVLQNGQKTGFGLAFKLVNGEVKSVRMQKDVYNTSTESLETGNLSATHLQTYHTLDGEIKGIWQDNKLNNVRPLYLTNMTPKQIAEKPTQYALKRMSSDKDAGGRGLIMLASSVTVCETLIFEVTLNCTNYNERKDDSTVTVCARREIRTATMCTDIPMPDYPYNPTTGSNPVPPSGINTTPVKTPCELAKEAAQKANSILNNEKFKEKILEIAKDMKFKSKENWVGFGINKSTGMYETTPVLEGSEGGINYNNFDYPHLNIYANVHLHTYDLDNHPSVTDIYALFKDFKQNPEFQMSFVLSAADNSITALVINDKVKFANFVEQYPQMTQQFRNSEVRYLPLWDINKDVGIEWYDAYKKHITSVIPSNEELMNAKMRALAYILEKFDTGVSFLRAEDINKDVKPFRIFSIQNPDGTITYAQTDC